MGIIIVLIIVIIAIIIVRCLSHKTEYKENKELLKRELLVFGNEIKTEQAKQQARVAGEMTRSKINELANKNNKEP